MIRHKRTIPLDVEEHSVMLQQYTDDLHWKLVQHMDTISGARNAVQQRDANQKRMSGTGQ